MLYNGKTTQDNACNKMPRDIHEMVTKVKQDSEVTLEYMKMIVGENLMDKLPFAIDTMKRHIVNLLDDRLPSIYIYGSFALDDFKPGWSDIDILVLTQKTMSMAQAQRLVNLRQTMLEEMPDNPYYRSFEGGILTLNTFITGSSDTVVYWGTSGERITDGYDFDAFCMSELIDTGILIYGNDIRNDLSRPTFNELKENVQKHYETIRKYAQKTERSLYSFGWLLDISRCIYTIRTGKIISKTAAGEWALNESLCPCPNVLAKAVEIRKTPLKYKNDENTLNYAETLGMDIQRYADILESEITKIHSSYNHCKPFSASCHRRQGAPY
jgi:predicted nucleotidyltransferase